MELLETVKHGELTTGQEADFAFIWFYAAHAAKDAAALAKAEMLLRDADTPEPYFNQRRLEHLLALSDDLAVISLARPLPTLGFALRGLHALSRYALIQPNIAGFGLNLNRIADDLVERALVKNKSKNTPADVTKRR